MAYDIYSKENDTQPYTEWTNTIKDGKAIRRLDQNLKKVTLGLTSHCKPVKTNPEIFEIIIDEGPGYRIYCSKIDSNRFVVLNGGIKKTQQKDIDKAVEYLEDYKKRHPKEKE